MEDGSKYDVFISYSRKDYVRDGKPFEGNIISKIMELFDENGISYWIDREGIRSGDEFMEEIAAAITNSTMMVFVSSYNSNQSEWTAGEISTARRKKKRIVPVLIDDAIFSDKFIVALEQLDHVDYYQQPKTALSDLLRAVEAEKKNQLLIIEEKKKSEENQKRKKQIATERMRFFVREKALKDTVHAVIQLHEEMGHEEKVCPVCQCSLPLDEPYCLKCGWYFHPLEQLCEGEVFLDEEDQLRHEERLVLSRSLWKVKRSSDSSNVVAELKRKIEALTADLVKKQKECDDRREEWLKLSSTAEKDKERQNAQIKLLKSDKEELLAKNSELQKTIQELNVQLEELKKKLAPKPAAKSRRVRALTRDSATSNLDSILKDCMKKKGNVYYIDPVSVIDLERFVDQVRLKFAVNLIDMDLYACRTIGNLVEAVLDRLPIKS